MDEFTPRQRMQIKKDLHDESRYRMSIIENKDYDKIIRSTNHNIIVKKVHTKDHGIDPFEKIKRKKKKKIICNNIEVAMALAESS